MNASFFREVSAACSQDAAGSAKSRVAATLRSACLACLLAGAGSAALSQELNQERILSDVPVGQGVESRLADDQSIGSVPQTIVEDGGFDAQAPGGGPITEHAGPSLTEPAIDGHDGEYVVGDLPTELCGPATRCQRWTAQVDALMLWQGGIPSRPIYIDSVSDATVLDVNQAQPAMSAGPRYALIYHRDACRALEINYFQVQSFEGQATVYPGQNPYAMKDLLGLSFNDIDAARVTTSGGIKSLEFNLRRSHCDGIIRWLAGFRWVEWNQAMTVGDQFTDAGGLGGIEGAQINTGNNLYGGQLGADVMLWNAGHGIKFNGIAKGGVFYNYQAYQTTDIVSDRGFANTFAATADEPAFVGEVGFNGAFAITNWLSWRAGYTLFWLGGVAIPANQLSVTNVGNETTGINSYSSVLLHGVTTGLEARW